MHLETKKGLAAGAAAAWREQYPAGGLHTTNSHRRIEERLVALGPSPSPEAVDEAIGNLSWTRCSCHECGEAVEAVVRIGQEPECESHTADICRQCLEKALELLRGA